MKKAVFILVVLTGLFFVAGEDSVLASFATMDFGDAPDSYSTLEASGGARHGTSGPSALTAFVAVGPSGLFLGASVDLEFDGQPSLSADGDGADEDGVVFTGTLTAGESCSVNVTSSSSGILNAYIDFNIDGDFSDADEHIFIDQNLAAGLNSLNFTVPEIAVPGDTFARFRLSSQGQDGPAGYAADGEVEDYAIAVQSADSDEDGVSDYLEGCSEDRDGDGDANCDDYDPTGYFYDEADGRIISGCSIQVEGPGDIDILQNGSGGYYQFTTDGTAGRYTITANFPPEYGWSDTCLAQGVLDPTGQTNPLVLGDGENGVTGFIANYGCNSNPFYLQFDLQAGDPAIFNNNFPLQRVAPASIPTLSEWGMILLTMLTLGAGFTIIRRQQHC